MTSMVALLLASLAAVVLASRKVSTSSVQRAHISELTGVANVALEEDAELEKAPEEDAEQEKAPEEDAEQDKAPEEDADHVFVEVPECPEEDQHCPTYVHYMGHFCKDVP